MARQKIPPSSLEMELRDEVRTKFLGAMVRYNIKTKAQAAREIEITKAAFGLYVNKKATPSAFILLKACAKWGLSIRYGGITFSAADFAHSVRETKIPEQQTLFGALHNLEANDVDIAIRKKGPSALELKLKIQFGT